MLSEQDYKLLVVSMARGGWAMISEQDYKLLVVSMARGGWAMLSQQQLETAIIFQEFMLEKKQKNI